MPLYREDLQQPPAACDVPGCAENHESESSGAGDLWFHASCHPSSPTWVRYRGDVLTIQCAACKRDIASLVIASQHSEPET